MKECNQYDNWCEKEKRSCKNCYYERCYNMSDEEKKTFQYYKDYVEQEYISKDKIKAFIKEELPDDEICSCCKIFDVNGVDLKRKLQSLLEEEE